MFTHIDLIIIEGQCNLSYLDKSNFFSIFFSLEIYTHKGDPKLLDDLNKVFIFFSSTCCFISAESKVCIDLCIIVVPIFTTKLLNFWTLPIFVLLYIFVFFCLLLCITLNIDTHNRCLPSISTRQGQWTSRLTTTKFQSQQF